jgi:hypothetical protein
MAKQPPQPKELPLPSAGGSYLRDPITGALTKIEDDAPDAALPTEQPQEELSNG